MLFNVQAALADILARPAATSATIATQAPEPASVSRLSRVSQGGSAEIAPVAAPTDLPSDPDRYPFGLSVNGDPLTWTGRPVTRAAWEGLSDWEKHGSTGLLWNALTRQWEAKGAQP